MSAMDIISDIEKLRPELLEKSDAELERLAAEIEMARQEKARRSEAERRSKLVAEASDRVEAVIAGLKWLHAEGFLSAKVSETFTRADGQFNPSTYLRAPRSEEVVTKPRGEAPKRRRRRRLPDGTLVPSNAAVVAGEV
jgi:predicted nuclease with TOPRIM domain